jgi:hypothetical protein
MSVPSSSNEDRLKKLLRNNVPTMNTPTPVAQIQEVNVGYISPIANIKVV